MTATPPAISVVLPARDEGDRVGATIASALDAAAGPDGVEFVVVDDCSAPGRRPVVGDAAARRRTTIVRSARHLGVGAARNLAARHARGRVLFVTDAHTRFSAGWDRAATRLLAPERILSVTILDSTSAWRGHGCRLVVPYMGTRWNTAVPGPTPEDRRVQVASSAGTVVERALFARLGGYDEGMVHYGGFEPEFSVRAWRAGAEIVHTTDIEITHRFKPREEAASFVGAARTALVHNCLRFGTAHLPESMILEMVRLHALEFPEHIREALVMLEERGAWRRREELAATLPHDFAWFVRRFGLLDQIGRPLPET
ncbi:glycosyltransferase family 2 protein [Streptomyces sp. UNOB3_S3]|uniref:glycosyltransferase family 2 protein n=1 Tax=Streptomyces sp. UNOB3_S3 TaxID=2871682 RepID=UPI001E3282A5|nr:glycosyltransferase [Streptomyces sp. UNOB3_S3]MCC3774546.1 glycosyltransferase [Streptomyces sp. UNOB3_S3]